MENLNAFVPKFLEVRQEMVHGWVGLNRRKCGNPGCRCARGELHESLSFGTREEGRNIHRGIEPEKVESLKAATGRWRAYREARAKLVKEFRQLLGDIDALERCLCVSCEDWMVHPKPEEKEA
jgi:hypothetical protein